MSAKVLIVEASSAKQAVLERCTDGLGLSVHTAATGGEALESLIDDDYAMVLLAPSLPDMSGIEFAGLLFGDQNKRHIPVTMVAPPAAWENVMHRAYEVGVADHIGEPIQRGVLRAKLRLYLRFYASRVRLAERASHLERSNHHLQEFAHAAAHDLRAPLRTIAGFTSRLANDEIDRSERERCLGAVESGTERMGALIDDMLRYAQSGTGTTDESVSLETCVREVLADLHSEIRGSGAEVSMSPLPTVTGNSTQIRQAIQNLIANALKYRRSGVAPVVAIQASIRPGGCQLDIRDNGRGFEPGFEEEMFRPFRRLVSREDGGSGIGLATTRRIVERHGGTIVATGVPGKGATFQMYLPMSSPEVGAFRSRIDAGEDVATLKPMVRSSFPPMRVRRSGEAHFTEEVLASDATQPRILLVDDSAMDAQLLSFVMDRAWDIVAVSSAEDALATIDGQIDLVVSDYNMSTRDGLWLLRQVADRYPQTRRVLLTGVPDERCHAALADGSVHVILEKSADLKPIGEAIRAELEQGMKLERA